MVARILDYQVNLKIGHSNSNVFGLTSFQAHMARSRNWLDLRLEAVNERLSSSVE
jgi:hypothetical protein